MGIAVVVPVVILGARGRMGRFAAELLATAEGFEVAAGLDVDDDLDAALAECGATLGLDLTVAGLGCDHGLALLEHGLRPVIGTSGVSLEENQRLDRRARELSLGGLVVPNFSLGIFCLQRAVEEAARHLPEVEIVELHHTGKRDAPSGTALDTAERIARARGEAADGDESADENDASRGLRHHGVPIHSLRLAGAFSHQEVLCSGPGETLTVRHDMLGPEAFGPGILAALRYAATATGVARGIGAALGE